MFITGINIHDVKEVCIWTSGRKYNLVMPCDVPRVWARDFDYIDEADSCSPRLVKYRKIWYDVNDTMPTHQLGVKFAEWDCYIGESFLSGVLFRYVPGSDFKQVQCGTYYCYLEAKSYPP